MSVISSASKSRRNNTSNEREVSEYDGIWLNFGVKMGDDAESAPFVRLPRGVAVADLKTKKVYDNMEPDYAAQVTLVNQIIELCRIKGLQLAEGESIPMNLEVQLYRRQEEADVPAPTKKDMTALEATLFG